MKTNPFYFVNAEMACIFRAAITQLMFWPTVVLM